MTISNVVLSAGSSINEMIVSFNSDKASEIMILLDNTSIINTYSQIGLNNIVISADSTIYHAGVCVTERITNSFIEIFYGDISNGQKIYKYAPANSGTMSGYIVDNSGVPIPGAMWLLKDANGNIIKTSQNIGGI